MEEKKKPLSCYFVTPEYVTFDYTHGFHAEKQTRAQAKSSTVQEIHIAQRTMSLKDMRQQKNVRHRVSRRSKWTKVCTVQQVQSFQTFFCQPLDLCAF